MKLLPTTLFASCLILLSAVYLLLQMLSLQHEGFQQIDNPEKQQALLIKLLTTSNTPEITFDVISTLPHTQYDFTEGLVWQNGMLYESSGLYGVSRINLTNVATNQRIKSLRLAPPYFAEGITLFNGLLYQLTYHEHQAFIYNAENLQLLKSLPYPYEGWGLTTDGHALIASDGTAVLHFLQPQTLQPLSQLTVKDKRNITIAGLNELEYIHGKIFANVWPTDIIVIISPQTGVIEGWLNLQRLKPKQELISSDTATNGIAYDEASDHLMVTGKRWSSLFVIHLKNF